jgi:hypothetical protein
MAGGAEVEEDIVVQVVGFAFAGGNAVYVEAGDGRYGVGEETGGGLFDDFAAGSVPDFGVGGLDVSAGKEPAVEAAMMNEQEAFVVGGEDESSAGDVAGSELGAGEGRQGGLEEHEDELAGFGGSSVGGVGEGTDERGYGWGVHKNKARSKGSGFLL